MLKKIQKSKGENDLENTSGLAWEIYFDKQSQVNTFVKDKPRVYDWYCICEPFYNVEYK